MEVEEKKSPGLRVLGDAEVLLAGYGYWVRVDAAVDWIVEVSYSEKEYDISCQHLSRPQSVIASCEREYHESGLRRR